MSSLGLHRVVARFLAVCVLAGTAAFPALLTAQTVEKTAPPNSFLTGHTFGKGWRCQRGYRENNDACRAVVVPENGHLRSSGDSWGCDRGYLDKRGACEKVVVPEHGYLSEQDYSGRGWLCKRGYTVSGTECVAVTPPANAFLGDYRSRQGWECERGYRRDKESCIAITLPENSHLDFSGNDWACNEPFRKRDGRCVER